MDLRLQGKCAVITGASKGREIGCAVAEVLAEEGCDLVLVSRTQDTREAAVEEIRGRHQVAVAVHAPDMCKRPVCPL